MALGAFGPNRRDLGRRKARVAHALTARLPALVDHVLGVVGGRSEEEMVRVDASAIVATVTNKEIGGYGANVDFVGKPVRRIRLVRIADHAVALPVSSPLPLPTVGGIARGAMLPECTLRGSGPCAVPVTIGERIASLESKSSDGVRRGWRSLAATTLAMPMRDWFGKLCADILGLHRNPPFCAKPPGDSRRRGGVSIGCATGVIIAQMRGLLQAQEVAYR
jgi:hypothetical protein